MLSVLVLVIVVITAGLLFRPRLANAPLWRATITPLASIIGSGFLVLGPILQVSYGGYAPLIMALLCAVAYGFGSAIRYNIATLDLRPDVGMEQRLETMASWTLAVAYTISVAYYLNLFGAFGVSLTPMDDGYHAKLLTSAVFLVILFVGWTRGFSALERMEQVAVGIKLAIIAGLLVGLAVYFYTRAAAGDLVFEQETLTGWPALTLAFGLIVTVQGFETSRYLGVSYDSATRIRSMRLAQLLAAVIYMIYICLLAYVFVPDEQHLNETAIIDMMLIVAPILPVLLVAAALSAQFSAAVADTSGSGGLIVELTQRRITQRQAYAVLVLSGLVLTWTANVFEIISYASRAFAVYYAMQALIAALASWRSKRQSPQLVGFLALAVLGISIAVLGVPVE
ncbi:hypothetical protein [Granulosicoccus antarcticus]|uniref:APC family permease n=1 Tax=Granulosicoccus antarcticus IMCC3135 TaxID=1192854 RepID=A0A2Z2NNK8_9GAMM|nr:hypothetical protein [Granulosicoccus antarcticus]ASJ72996.1 hypothetical protein IMCC3135_14555 [Granulosicoccus antarcticus IMCC3135]